MKFLPVEGITEDIWKVGIDDLNWVNNANTCGCSYVVLPARLLGMTYPDYLRWCRSKGGELRGKTGYTTVVFKDKNICKEICDMINKEWKRVEKVCLM